MSTSLCCLADWGKPISGAVLPMVNAYGVFMPVAGKQAGGGCQATDIGHRSLLGRCDRYSVFVQGDQSLASFSSLHCLLMG
jgi:hypothetical protein